MKTYTLNYFYKNFNVVKNSIEITIEAQNLNEAIIEADKLLSEFVKQKYYLDKVQQN